MRVRAGTDLVTLLFTRRGERIFAPRFNSHFFCQLFVFSRCRLNVLSASRAQSSFLYSQTRQSVIIRNVAVFFFARAALEQFAEALSSVVLTFAKACCGNGMHRSGSDHLRPRCAALSRGGWQGEPWASGRGRVPPKGRRACRCCRPGSRGRCRAGCLRGAHDSS
jgi:hypothetical protein